MGIKSAQPRNHKSIKLVCFNVNQNPQSSEATYQKDWN